MFCALIKTKSAHDKLQSIKNAWSKDEIWCLEMAALLAQGNSESDKYRFNTAFLTGSDYYRNPNVLYRLRSIRRTLQQRKELHFLYKGDLCPRTL